MSAHAIDALLVLQRSDVEHLAARREHYADLPLLCIDPGILETVLQAGFGNYALRRVDPGHDALARAHTEARVRATMIDLKLTRERERLFGAGVFTGWDRSAMYLPLHAMLTAQAMLPAVERALPEPRLGLLRPDNALLFNFDSMVQTEIYAADARRWTIVDRYAKGRGWNPLLLDACFDFDAIAERARQAPVQVLTHLASCFYDAECFGRAVGDTFGHGIDLPSVYCDVPVRREQVYLTTLGRLDAAYRDEASALYRERARQVYLEQLADLIPSRQALHEQADVLAQRSYLQAINFHGLRRVLQGHRPHLVIADHDNGVLGPLFSLAAALGSAITVMPHSGYTNVALPHAQRVTAIERDGYAARVVTVLGQPVHKRAVRFRRQVQPRTRPQARQLCVLVNSMCADGLYPIDLFGLIHLFKGLQAACARHGAELSVRLKPSMPALNVVSGALGVRPDYLLRSTQAAIEDVAQATDLCLAWGELTTGSINFLDAGGLVLHVSEDDWSVQGPSQAPFVHDDLVHSYRVDAALALVERLLEQPAEFQRLQQRQATRYAQGRVDAHDTFFEDTPHPRNPTPC